MPFTKLGKSRGELECGENQELSFGYGKFDMAIGHTSGNVQKQTKFWDGDMDLSAMVTEMVFKTLSLDTVSSKVSIQRTGSL